jgi:hypothetical protein
MIAHFVLSLIVSIALCFAIGCSKSSTTQASFGSSSDSSSSPFKSSSKSSSGDDDEEKEEESAFQRDVRNYTVEFAESSDEHDVESFQRNLGAIAEGYGITDWERSEGVFVTIGHGLGESDLDDEDANELAAALSNDNHDHLILIRAGVKSRRTE